jgi:hypothetical protein
MVLPCSSARLRRARGPAPWQLLALLGFALFSPAALPAGGGDRRLPEVRRRRSPAEPLLSASVLSLRCAPERQAPVLTHVASGESLRVLQQWFSPEGGRWLRVQASGRAGRPARGWLRS